MVRAPTARRLAGFAAGLAFSSAAVSLFWTLGGTLLLDTVGGAVEKLARERSLGAVALGATTVLLKVAAGLLALALRRPATAGLQRRAVLAANGLASALLIVWGGANLVVGALVLGGVIDPSGDVDRHALRWHVFVWDLWFLVWGLALAVAVAGTRRAWTRPPSDARTGGGDAASDSALASARTPTQTAAHVPDPRRG